METTKVDKKGRVHLKKRIREEVGIKPNSLVKIKVDRKKVIIEPIESSTENIVERYYGIIKVEKCPEDLEDFMVGVVRKWAKAKDT